METISLSELKIMHSLNKAYNIKRNKVNNLKKIYSFNTINSKESRPIYLKNINSFTNKKPILLNKREIQTPFNKNHSFNFRYLKQKFPLKLSLYTLLAMKKNKFYEEIEKVIQNENVKSNKTNNKNIFKNIEYIKTQAKINKKNKNKYESRKSSIVFLSYFKNDFNESEKIRFYSMMKKLSAIKFILEAEPNNNYKIIKNLLLREGINDKKYFSENHFNNLIRFINNKKSILDPTNNLKENLINIMDNHYNYSLLNKKVNKNDYNNEILRKKKLRNIININETIYRNKNFHFLTLDNFNINRFDLDLKNNLNRQTEIRKRVEKLSIHDIKKEPEKIMDSLGIELNEHKNDIINNQTIYKRKKKLNNDNLNLGFNSDLDIFKKKHLVTEFACFIKAKDNYDINLIKSKYNL